MKRDRIDSAVDGFADRLDAAAEGMGRDGDGEPRIASGETKIARGFPYFVVVALLVWLAAAIYLGEFTIPGLIELLCLSFVFCFAILGVPCSLMMSKGVFPGWMIILFAAALSLLLWVCGAIFGDFSFLVAVSDMLGAIGIELHGLTREIVCFLATYAVVLFTSIGVTSVISSYLRIYMPNVFSSMASHAKEGKRGKAERFFMVPDIIDVREVVLEPERDQHVFHFSSAFSLWAYLFILGLLVSSYLFVNPLLIEELGSYTMLAVTLMLSMFTPALVIPWMVVRTVGAKVRSDAPRDYYLWIGARKRLFTTFMALGVFMMMFVLSVYLGTNAFEIVMNYVSFLVPLFATTAVYAGLYVNNFETPVCEQVCEKFEEGKGRGVPRSDDLDR